MNHIGPCFPAKQFKRYLYSIQSSSHIGIIHPEWSISSQSSHTSISPLYHSQWLCSNSFYNISTLNSLRGILFKYLGIEQCISLYESDWTIHGSIWIWVIYRKSKDYKNSYNNKNNKFVVYFFHFLTMIKQIMLTYYILLSNLQHIWKNNISFSGW